MHTLGYISLKTVNYLNKHLLFINNQLKVIIMSRKKREKIKAQKKMNPKKEKYMKFHKEKSGVLDLSFPDLADDTKKEIRADEERVGTYLRYALANARREEKMREERKPR